MMTDPPLKFESAAQTLPRLSVYAGPPALTRQTEETTGVKVGTTVKVDVAVFVDVPVEVRVDVSVAVGEEDGIDVKVLVGV